MIAEYWLYFTLNERDNFRWRTRIARVLWKLLRHITHGNFLFEKIHLIQEYEHRNVAEEALRASSYSPE